MAAPAAGGAAPHRQRRVPASVVLAVDQDDRDHDQVGVSASDILIQITAIQAALDKVALGLLDGHAHTC
jgi:hypothetical protein